MIISHKYQFIFIKTAKTAGTSIEVFLSQHCGDEDILTPIYPYIESHRARNYKGLWNPLPEIVNKKGRVNRELIKALYRRNKFLNHISAKQIKWRISQKVWNKYFKFCIERNPWDKTLSHYHMLNYRSGGNMSLEQYFEKGKFCINYPRYTDGSDNLLVDRVVKYENLTQELSEIFSDLGIPFKGVLDVTAKSGYRRDRTPYNQVFSNEQKEAIEKVFKKEIIMHKYAF